MTGLVPEGCHGCGAPVAERPTDGVELAITVDTGMAYVVMCPDCAGVDPTEALRDLDPEYDGGPAYADVATCWACEGQGDVLAYVDADGVTQTRECSACRGTGMRGAA